VELLCEGSHLAKHSGWFARSGVYGSDLDYIILDCCTIWPKRKHPSMCIICPLIHFPFFQANLTHRISKLYHVVFSEEYHKVSILNNMLRSIHDRGLLNP
jgi:hypothetical protein